MGLHGFCRAAHGLLWLTVASAVRCFHCDLVGLASYCGGFSRGSGDDWIPWVSQARMFYVPSETRQRNSRLRRPFCSGYRSRWRGATGTSEIPEGLQTVMRVLSSGKRWWSGLALLAFLAVVTLRLPCLVGLPLGLGGSFSSSPCSSQMEASQGDCCGQGVLSSAQSGELAPVALALLPTGLTSAPVSPDVLLYSLGEIPAPSPWGRTMTVPLAPRAPPSPLV